MPEFEAHLWTCPDCRAYLEQLQALRSRLRRLGHEVVPEDLRSRVMSAVRAEHRRMRRPRAVRLRLRRALAAAAAALALVAAGLYAATHRPQGLLRPVPDQQVAPLVMEYADFRGAQPFGDRDGMTLVETQMAEGQRR
jgi:anti-sigma factor RsiW